MLGEIDKDFYCSSNSYDNGICKAGYSDGQHCYNCVPCCHRKHPTPEQFKEEYGRDYPDDGAVYIQLKDHTGWLTTVKRQIKENSTDGSNSFFYWSGYKTVTAVVCACTPYGKPDDNRRPE